MAKEKTSGTGRTRNWSFLAYPDSAPLDWRSILDDMHIEWVESPLHDKDVNPTGEQKKPHWHVLLLFDGVKTFEQVKAITDSLNATIPVKANSARGLVRYMAHLDHPDKFQYSKSDIIGHGGVDIADLLKPTSSSRYQLIGEMMDFVRDNDIIEMKDLLYYARTERFEDWFPLLCDNSAYIMDSLIKSNRHSSRNTLIDMETGEIL